MDVCIMRNSNNCVPSELIRYEHAVLLLHHHKDDLFLNVMDKYLRYSEQVTVLVSCKFGRYGTFYQNNPYSQYFSARLKENVQFIPTPRAYIEKHYTADRTSRPSIVVTDDFESELYLPKYCPQYYNFATNHFHQLNVSGCIEGLNLAHSVNLSRFDLQLSLFNCDYLRKKICVKSIIDILPHCYIFFTAFGDYKKELRFQEIINAFILFKYQYDKYFGHEVVLVLGGDFYLAGSDECKNRRHLRSWLKNLKKEHNIVFLKKTLNQSEKKALLRLSYAAIYLDESPDLENVKFAMSLGTPLICSESGLAEDMVIYGSSGFTVDPERIDHIAAYMETLSTPTTYHQFSTAARRNYLTKYSETSLFLQTVSIKEIPNFETPEMANKTAAANSLLVPYPEMVQPVTYYYIKKDWFDLYCEKHSENSKQDITQLAKTYISSSPEICPGCSFEYVAIPRWCDEDEVFEQIYGDHLFEKESYGQVLIKDSSLNEQAVNENEVVPHQANLNAGYQMNQQLQPYQHRPNELFQSSHLEPHQSSRIEPCQSSRIEPYQHQLFQHHPPSIEGNPAPIEKYHHPPVETYHPPSGERYPLAIEQHQSQSVEPNKRQYTETYQSPPFNPFQFPPLKPYLSQPDRPNESQSTQPNPMDSMQPLELAQHFNQTLHSFESMLAQPMHVGKLHQPMQQLQKQPLQQLQKQPLQQLQNQSMQPLPNQLMQQFQNLSILPHDRQSMQQLQNRSMLQFENQPMQKVEDQPIQQFDKQPMKQFENHPMQQQPLENFPMLQFQNQAMHQLQHQRVLQLQNQSMQQLPNQSMQQLQNQLMQQLQNQKMLQLQNQAIHEHQNRQMQQLQNQPMQQRQNQPLQQRQNQPMHHLQNQPMHELQIQSMQEHQNMSVLQLKNLSLQQLYNQAMQHHNLRTHQIQPMHDHQNLPIQQHQNLPMQQHQNQSIHEHQNQLIHQFQNQPIQQFQNQQMVQFQNQLMQQLQNQQLPNQSMKPLQNLPMLQQQNHPMQKIQNQPLPHIQNQPLQHIQNEPKQQNQSIPMKQLLAQPMHQLQNQSMPPSESIQQHINQVIQQQQKEAMQSYQSTQLQPKQSMQVHPNQALQPYQAMQPNPNKVSSLYEPVLQPKQTFSNLPQVSSNKAAQFVPNQPQFLLNQPPFLANQPKTLPIQPRQIFPNQPSQILPNKPAPFLANQPAHVLPNQPKTAPIQPPQILQNQSSQILPNQPPQVLPDQHAQILPNQPKQSLPNQSSQVLPNQPPQASANEQPVGPIYVGIMQKYPPKIIHAVQVQNYPKSQFMDPNQPGWFQIGPQPAIVEPQFSGSEYSTPREYFEPEGEQMAEREDDDPARRWEEVFANDSMEEYSAPGSELSETREDAWSGICSDDTQSTGNRSWRVFNNSYHSNSQCSDDVWQEANQEFVDEKENEEQTDKTDKTDKHEINGSSNVAKVTEEVDQEKECKECRDKKCIKELHAKVNAKLEKTQPIDTNVPKISKSARRKSKRKRVKKTRSE